VAKEQRWLPALAPQLPLAIPAPIAMGRPGDGYPRSWSIYGWLEGETAAAGVSNPRRLALDLADFVSALQCIDRTGGPPPGSHNFHRGQPLALRDAATRAAIEQLHGVIDTAAATGAWEAALNAPVWHGAPVWVHGDLAPGNLLLQDGRLNAVIDFGGLGVGDPAVDLIAAWNLLTPEARDLFRRALGPDDATWARGRGWALSTALVALPYYRDTNPPLAEQSRHTIAAVLADPDGGAR
jgi:aminoglycoside phosphotransferase (APT) family kinase protein